MPESSWPENDAYSELEPLQSLLADFAPLPESEPNNPKEIRQDGRRRKAAIVLTLIWSIIIVLHLVAWGSWLILGLTSIMAVHALRVIFAPPMTYPNPLTDGDVATAPSVSIVVAAKNEEAVIGRLVKGLCNLDYPQDRYEVWIVDDNSSDRTPHVLAELAQQYPNLNVFQRPLGSGGGKSGALNQVLPLTKGEIIGVFDADAQVSPDLIRRVVPLFEKPRLGAIQVRKAISNLSANAWIRGQVAEMAFDSYIQQQRTALGGVGELRGNGQFVRRVALDDCGGWNEETITDDLDLTIRLHLHRWDIDFMLLPAVQEEGVTRSTALWHQRNRWAEGGYQRYLDYWQLILRNRMGTRKTFDLVMFWLTQYFLPTAAVPDFMMAIWRSHSLILGPIGGLSVSLSLIGTVVGLRRIRQAQKALQAAEVTPMSGILQGLVTMIHALYSTLYLLHWLPVMASTTARMSIRPKRLKWVKTVHAGTEELAIENS